VTDVLPLFKPQFRIWLLIADQLGRVISTYRPRLEGARDQVADLYTFEEFVETSEAWDIEPQLLGEYFFQSCLNNALTIIEKIHLSCIIMPP
jgi:hypothetical protein